MQATEHATQYQNMAKQSKSTAKTHTTSWCSRLGPHRTSLSWIPNAWAVNFTNVRASARAGCSYGRWLPGFRLCVGDGKLPAQPFGCSPNRHPLLNHMANYSKLHEYA